MVKTLEYDSYQTPINFADAGRRSLSWGWGDETVIWSCRFSADGNEVGSVHSNSLHSHTLARSLLEDGGKFLVRKMDLLRI